MVRQLKVANARDEIFLAWMDDAERAAEQLEALLRAKNSSPADADAALSRLESQCTRCHGRYRD